MQEAFLEVGIVIFSGGVKLFNVIFFEDVFDQVLAVYDHLQVFVLVFSLEGEFLAASNAVCHFQQLFGDLSNGKGLAFLDLSKIISKILLSPLARQCSLLLIDLYILLKLSLLFFDFVIQLVVKL